MSIPREYATSNPLVRDALAETPFNYGDRVGDFVSPDYPIDAEEVSHVVIAEHKLNIHTERAPDAEAVEVIFGTGTTADIYVIEQAEKFKIDSRKLETEAKSRGVNLLAQRATLIREDLIDGKEYRISQQVFSAANFDADHKENALNLATADLVKKFDGYQDVIKSEGRAGKAPYLLLGKLAYRAMRVNEGFVKYVSAPGVLTAGSRSRTLEALAEYLELSEVRVADYSRTFEGDATATDFWNSQTALLFVRNQTISNRTFAFTPVVPYGEAQGVAQGTLIDVRTEPLPGTERLTECGVYMRYNNYIGSANCAFLLTATTGHA